jgi:hypothetical protein
MNLSNKNNTIKIISGGVFLLVTILCFSKVDMSFAYSVAAAADRHASWQAGALAIDYGNTSGPTYLSYQDMLNLFDLIHGDENPFKTYKHNVSPSSLYKTDKSGIIPMPFDHYKPTGKIFQIFQQGIDTRVIFGTDGPSPVMQIVIWYYRLLVLKWVINKLAQVVPGLEELEGDIML